MIPHYSKSGATHANIAMSEDTHGRAVGFSAADADIVLPSWAGSERVCYLAGRRGSGRHGL